MMLRISADKLQGSERERGRGMGRAKRAGRSWDIMGTPQESTWEVLGAAKGGKGRRARSSWKHQVAWCKRS